MQCCSTARALACEPRIAALLQQSPLVEKGSTLSYLLLCGCAYLVTTGTRICGAIWWEHRENEHVLRRWCRCEWNAGPLMCMAPHYVLVTAPLLLCAVSIVARWRQAQRMPPMCARARKCGKRGRKPDRCAPTSRHVSPRMHASYLSIVHSCCPCLVQLRRRLLLNRHRGSLVSPEQ